MNNIIIKDNFLNEDELSILQYFINNAQFKYGHSSGNREYVTNLFFSTYNTSDFFLRHIKEKIEMQFSKKFKINRHYMHIQTFGQDGSYHIDDEGDHKYTFCLYITENDANTLEYIGGDFLIKIPNQSFILCVETIMNRGIIFPSNYLHKGMAYNNYCSNKRLCLTWKLEEII